MTLPSRPVVRAVFAVVVLTAGGVVAVSYVTADANVARSQIPDDRSPTLPADDRSIGDRPDVSTVDGTPGGDDSENRLAGTSARTLDPDNVTESDPGTPGGLTVVATQGFYTSNERAELVVFDADGDVVYYDSTYRVYFDVDPIPEKQYTVEFVAARHLDGADCADVRTERCTYNTVQRVNLTTGERREVYGEVTPQITSGRWHDVDRVNGTHLAIADIVRDSVRVVDTRTNRTTWEWSASDAYDPDQGGAEGDWTHINDVEVLQDGRFMVSVRNMDQVVFVEPGEGVQGNWTLGEDDNYDILYEQHNPDYIPAERGGPAISVADSENNRVLEYQRIDPETGEPTTASDGEWVRSWGWRDSRFQWPRDADRLPNGNTLVSDTHGDRIAEVDPDGTVVWNVTVSMPYEVERLGTGDESSGGQSMARLREERAANESLPPTGAVTHPDRTVVEIVWLGLKDTVPSLPVNGLLFALPAWVRFPDLVFGGLFLVSGLAWLCCEVYWSRYRPIEYLRRLPERTGLALDRR